MRGIAVLIRVAKVAYADTERGATQTFYRGGRRRGASVLVDQFDQGIVRIAGVAQGGQEGRAAIFHLQRDAAPAIEQGGAGDGRIAVRAHLEFNGGAPVGGAQLGGDQGA
ncbi:hypothetical protein KIV45_22770 [Janthinobacterium lividum]|nr:hypothetical protein KIV45_22770 [Janthinobacterium lividum]